MAPEVLDGKYSYQTDLFALGLVLWEITALLPSKKRTSLFDKLVNDVNEELVEEHPLLREGSREIIISCTRRNPTNRLDNMIRVLQIVNLPRARIPVQEVVANTCEELELSQICYKRMHHHSRR